MYDYNNGNDEVLDDDWDDDDDDDSDIVDDYETMDPEEFLEKYL